MSSFLRLQKRSLMKFYSPTSALGLLTFPPLSQILDCGFFAQSLEVAAFKGDII